MKLPFIDRIWRVRGEVPIDPPLDPGEVFARLEPLLRTQGTSYSVEGNTLTYSKHNPAAQDKLATFTRGTLQVDPRDPRPVLRFDLSSTALFMCFLAPLLFLGFAQLAVAINAWEKPGLEASEENKEDEQKAKAPKPLHPVDRFLGAPAPEDPSKKKDKEEEEEGRHSPEPGYVLAGLFFLTYLVGRWLEPWLIRRRFRAALAESPEVAPDTRELRDPAATS